MRKVRASALLICVALSACATTHKFTAKMNGFVGQSEAAIVGAYGAPQSVYTLADGSRVLTYTRGGVVTIPGTTTYQTVVSSTTGSVQGQQGVRPVSGAYQAQTVTQVPVQSAPISINAYCTVHFTVTAAGVVAAWRSEGNNCVSSG